MSDSVSLMRMHLHALYTYNRVGRIAGCNQFDGGEVPRFHLARTASGNLWVLRDDVSRDTARALESYARCEPPLDDPLLPPKYEQQYLEILATDQPVDEVWQGPAYEFPRISAEDAETVVEIHAGNQTLLAAHMEDWLPDVVHRQPFVAVVDAGAAVAVCASARITADAHEAGVETAPGFRGSGNARRAVAVWAQRVTGLGARPLYSTSWDNVGSQAVAASLGLSLMGVDFHLR